MFVKQERSKPKKTEEHKPHSFKINDLVLVKDPDSAVFVLRFQPNYRVTAIFGNNLKEVQEEKEHRSVRRSSHMKYVEPSEKVIQQLPGKETLQNYGRSIKLLMAPKDIPNLEFKVDKFQETSDSEEYSINLLEGTGDVVQVMECSILPQSYMRNIKDSSQNSKSSEYLLNLWNSVADLCTSSINSPKNEDRNCHQHRSTEENQ